MKLQVTLETERPSGALLILARDLRTGYFPTRASVASTATLRGFRAYTGGHHVAVFNGAGERTAIVTCPGATEGDWA